jgi:hypothetical protein
MLNSLLSWPLLQLERRQESTMDDDRSWSRSVHPVAARKTGLQAGLKEGGTAMLPGQIFNGVRQFMAKLKIKWADY